MLIINTTNNKSGINFFMSNPLDKGKRFVKELEELQEQDNEDDYDSFDNSEILVK